MMLSFGMLSIMLDTGLHVAACCAIPISQGAGVEETRGQRYRLQEIPVQKLKVLYC